MEEPEECFVEEKLYFVSKRVEVEPAKGTQTLKLILALCVFGLYHSLCSLVVNLLSVFRMSMNIMSK